MLKKFHILGLGLSLFSVAHADLYTFGVNNTATNPNIYQINLTTGSTSQIFALTSQTGNLIYNGLAMDATQSKPIIYFRAGSGSGDLLAWSPNFGLTTVALAAQMPTGSASNASLYNGRYWYVGQGTDTLKSVEITFDGAGKPTGVTNSASLANFDATSATAYNFGDIAITSSGRLYGSTDGTKDFFRATVGASGTTNTSTNYSDVTTTNKQLQIAYDQSNGDIYGYSNGTSTFYKLTNLEGGAIAPTSTTLFAIGSLPGSSTTGLTDLVDVVVPYAIPEPSTWAVILAGLLALPLLRKRFAR